MAFWFGGKGTGLGLSGALVSLAPRFTLKNNVATLKDDANEIKKLGEVLIGMARFDETSA